MLCKPCKGKKFFIAIQVVYICSVSEEMNKSFSTTQIDCAEQILHLQKHKYKTQELCRRTKMHL